MKNYTTDVAVVGAGTAGGSAGYHCAAAGLKTLLIEADGPFGAAITGSDSKILSGVNGIFAVESDYQKQKHIRTTKKDVFTYLMEHANWSVPAWQAAALTGRSAGIWNWLETLGCEAEEAVAYNWYSNHTWLYFNDKKPRLEVVGKAFLDAGGETLPGALFEEILMEDGKAVGVAGHMVESGDPFTVRAKAVVLAFGEPGPVGGKRAPMGPPSDKPFIEKPDGFAIAEQVGAGRADQTASAMCMLDKPMGIGGPGDPNEPQEAYIRQPEELAVNNLGQRFVTEEILGTMEDGACAIAIQPQGTAFIVFDTNVNDYFCKNGFTSTKYRYGNEGPAYENLDERLQNAVEYGFGGCICTADSPEELAEKMGVPTDAFLETLEQYNAACASGRDDKFFKNVDFLVPIVGPRYYAMKVSSHMGASQGVLLSNDKLQILRDDGTPIEGLYGAGGAISTLNGHIYTHHVAGSRSTFGLVCGQMLGEILGEKLGKTE